MEIFSILMAIIAISGHKRSGKDLIGKIIRCLSLGCSPKDIPRIIEENYDLPLPYPEKGFVDWKIVKFADKLKDIICILIGCTREQLEDETFKNTELGEEWSKWTFKLNGEWNPKSAIFPTEAKAIKHCKNWDNTTINAQPYLKRYTPRELLQFIGTDLLRNQLHPQIWVNATMANYRPFIKNFPGLIKSNNKDLIVGNNYSMGKAILPNWIITDCRFPNECEDIKERNGILIRVNRPSVESDDKHPSEVALDDYKDFDYIIQNDHSIEDLIQKVKDILIKEDII